MEACKAGFEKLLAARMDMLEKRNTLKAKASELICRQSVEGAQNVLSPSDSKHMLVQSPTEFSELFLQLL